MLGCELNRRAGLPRRNETRRRVQGQPGAFEIRWFCWIDAQGSPAQRLERFQLTTDVKYPLARVASASFHALEVPTDECASGEGTRAGSH